jgi:hypothetical protein
MLIVMSAVETVGFKSGASLTHDRADGRETETVYAYGTLRLSDPARIDHSTNFRAVRVRRGSALYADLSGEWRSFPTNDYLRYNPPGPQGLDVAPGVWLRFAPEDAPRAGDVLTGIRPPDALVPPKGLSWGPESLPRLRALLAQGAVLAADFDGLTELVDAKNARVIDARFDPAATEAFLREFVRAREGRDPNAEEAAWAKNAATTFESLRVRLWIGVEDHRLYRAQVAGVAPEGDGRVAMDLRVDLSDFDETFAAVIPTGTLPMSSLALKRATLPTAEFAETGAGGSSASLAFGNLPTREIDANTDPDRDGLDNVLERFYGTNPNDADTDDDGSSDGEEVLSGRNPSGGGSLFGFGLGQKRS